MKFRSLDGVGDWQFGQGLESYALENNAIMLDVKTCVLSFLRDCWFDPEAGIDWLRLLGSSATQQEIKLTVRGIILKCQGVTNVNSIDLSFVNRRLSMSYNINTIFSSNSSQIVEVL